MPAAIVATCCVFRPFWYIRVLLYVWTLFLHHEGYNWGSQLASWRVLSWTISSWFLVLDNYVDSTNRGPLSISYQVAIKLAESLYCLFPSQFVLVLVLPMERLGNTRHFHPNLTEIFDANCSHSGFSACPSSLQHLYCLFALSQMIFVCSVELVPHPAVELCFHLDQWLELIQS